MKWFHISSSKDIKKVTTAKDDPGPSYIIPKVPAWIMNLKGDDPYREPEEPPRICVAPSLWQCVSGLGRAYDDGIPKGRVYAYEISISKVVKRTFESPETRITDEHWIVDEVIDDNTYINIQGWIDIENVFIEMKKFTISKTLGKMKMLEEQNDIWEKGAEVDNVKELILRIDHLQEILI